MFLTATAAQAQERRSCGGCHEKERMLEEGTVHGCGGGACADCHGGAPGEASREKGHGPGFLGKVERKAIPDFCAKCHSDVRRMNPFGLPTDQLSHGVPTRLRE